MVYFKWDKTENSYTQQGNVFYRGSLSRRKIITTNILCSREDRLKIRKSSGPSFDPCETPPDGLNVWHIAVFNM